MKGWKKLSEEIVLDHKWFKVYEDEVEIGDENNTKTKYLRFGASDVCTIVVFDRSKNRFLVNLEYSYSLDDRIHRKESENPFDGWIYKFPGGVLRPDEDPNRGAQREVEEETGLKVEIKKELAQVRNYFPRLNSIDHKLYAEVVSQGVKNPDTEEFGIQQEWFTKDQIEKLIHSRDRRAMHAYFLDTWLMFISKDHE